MTSWKHISLEERRKIESLVKQGFEYYEIGKILLRPAATIKEEIERNGGFSSYSSDSAHQDYLLRRKEASIKRTETMKNGKENNPYKQQPEISKQPTETNEFDLLSARIKILNCRITELMVKLDNVFGDNSPKAQLL